MKKQQITNDDWSNVARFAEMVVARAAVLKEIQKPRCLLSSAYGQSLVVVANALKDPMPCHARILAARIATTTQATASFIVCTGAVETNSLNNCVLFANGNVKVAEAVVGTIILSDGDVDVPVLINSVVFARGLVRLGCARDSVVLAQGSVTTSGSLTTSFLHAGGPVKIGTSVNSVVRTRSAATVGRIVHDIVLEQNALGAPELFPFFDPARLGIAVALADGELRVTQLEGAKSFARAGVKVGDVIVAMDKHRPTTPEAFRKILRRKELEGRVNLSVRRDDQPLVLTVKFAD